MPIDKDYRFDAEAGEVALRDLFKGRSQLLVYHFMFGPDWQEGCPSCSSVADGFDGIRVHLEHHEVPSCSRALDTVIGALRAAGVEPPHLATGELSVQPDWEARSQGKQHPAGYRAAARLGARLAPARAGQVATAAVTAGGEAARVHGLALVVGDKAGVLAAARQAAWRDARARAEHSQRF